MSFAEGTAVSFTADDGTASEGTVKSYENGKYHVEVEGGSVVEVAESKVLLRMATMTNKFGIDFGNILK